MDMHSSLDDATAVDVQVMGVWRLAEKWVGKKMRSLVTACAQLFLPLHVFATMYSTSGGHQSREDPLDDRDAEACLSSKLSPVTTGGHRLRQEPFRESAPFSFSLVYCDFKVPRLARWCIGERDLRGSVW